VSLGNQTDADCYAWQEFIALNWPTSGGTFGDPGDQSEVQWQTYMDIHQLFQPDGAPPPPWGSPAQLSAGCQNEARLTDAQAREAHPLLNAIKFSSEFLSESDTAEAFPRDAPAWLGDVNGNNVWFQVLVNKDEYDFIVEHQFYNAEKQLAFYTSQKQPPTTPLQFPAGCNGPSVTCPQTQTGALELKASWMKVPKPSDPKWKAYKLMSAVIVNPTTQKCEQVTVALVALHIIHKTESQPTWIWATFEHKDNAPTAEDIASDKDSSSPHAWNFYNPQCAPKTLQVPSACQYNSQATVTTSCDANTPPQYNIGTNCPSPAPTQVTRVNPIDPTAASVNATVQQAIQRAWGESVWQNYMLVNVVWSDNPPAIPPAGCTAGSPGCQGVTTPQLTQSLRPDSAVASAVLETYIQQSSPEKPLAKSNCVLCHQNATVANAPKATPYASDFSFVLGEAQSPVKSVRPRLQRGFQKIRQIFR
jgi:hypothetical protein